VAEIKDGALWDAQDVADFLKIEKETVYRWVQDGRLPCVKVGRLTRFRPADVREVAERGLPTEGAA
jgi:excisionase family DNA binding protein